MKRMFAKLKNMFLTPDERMQIRALNAEEKRDKRRFTRSEVGILQKQNRLLWLSVIGLSMLLVLMLIYTVVRDVKYYKMLVKKDSPYWMAHVPIGKPIDRYVRVSSSYGWRKNPFYNSNRRDVPSWRKSSEYEFTNGVDYACYVGTDVFTRAHGRVIKAGWDWSGGGNVIIIDHGGIYKTQYCHLSEMLVKVGQRVKKGQIIAKSGNTGFTTGAHVDYVIKARDVDSKYEKWVAINPKYFIYNKYIPKTKANAVAMLNKLEKEKRHMYVAMK